MLEIVGNKKGSGGCDFPQKMAELEIETVKRIIDLCREYCLNPFETIKIFGSNMVQTGADMQASFNAEHNKENEGGNE